MTWEEVIGRDDIVGGDMETQEDGRVFRGPISRVAMQNGCVYFHTDWSAVLTDEGWKKWENNGPVFINVSAAIPQDIGDGRVRFNIPFLGFAVIYPKGGSKLDPGKVAGLNLAA